MRPTIYHNGQPVFTGLQLPRCGLNSVYPDLEAVGPPLLSDAEIDDIAKNGTTDQRKFFDSSWILDQKSHSSCAGHAAAESLARSRFRRGLPKVLLSGAYVYSKVNNNEDQGSQLEDCMIELGTNGAAPASLVTWDMIFPNQQPKTADTEAAKYKGFECYAVRTQQGFWSALALGFDVVVAVHVDQNFMSLDGHGNAGVDSGPGNHAVMCDGLIWNGGRQALGNNSWGTSWGMSGRMGLTWNHFAQTFPNHTFFAVKSTSDSPGENPPVTP